jgi:hypothetical protein
MADRAEAFEAVARSAARPVDPVEPRPGPPASIDRL